MLSRPWADRGSFALFVIVSDSVAATWASLIGVRLVVQLCPSPYNNRFTSLSDPCR